MEGNLKNCLLSQHKMIKSSTYVVYKTINCLHIGNDKYDNLHRLMRCFR